MLAALGCSSGEDAPAETLSPEAAERDKAADHEDRSVVALLSPNLATWICSASLIAPRVVLTAAHCFEGGNYDKTGWSFVAFVGIDTKFPRAGDRRIPVRSFELDAAHDVALALLDQDAGLPALSWNAEPLAAGGLSVRFVGFGGKADAPTKYVRHASDFAVETVGEGEISGRGVTLGPCHGDSGGPLLMDGRVVAVGHTADEGCSGAASYGRVDVAADFIRRAMSKFGSP